ncbi:hypothetical protein E4U35_001645 [Claviceps purpurea]|nr:hypothetical protein E4U12_003286 [Claviceps purpurea]KAG6146304.1 hypothetical protein E4U28_000790 [Claviceps purpurea]KAG6155058.1 hypothetical protein E4U37_001521 [Claviceps purpurea]KAG6206534.1 hypothetical protein E4U35_001645 [Claviceps purpurea]KAG6207652.1 hypothetical protein E4U50_003626 [Claviceps purpurea]
MQQLSRQASHAHRMGLGDGDSNSSRQTGPQTSVERVRRNQEARRKARRNAQWKDDSRNQGGANGNTSNADGRRKTDEEYSPKQGQRRQHQRHRTRRRGCLTGRVRDIYVGRRRRGGKAGQVERGC